jgi:hypothetical protein
VIQSAPSSVLLEVLEELQAPSVRKREVAKRRGRRRRAVAAEQRYEVKLLVAAGMS